MHYNAIQIILFNEKNSLSKFVSGKTKIYWWYNTQVYFVFPIALDKHVAVRENFRLLLAFHGDFAAFLVECQLKLQISRSFFEEHSYQKFWY